MILPRVELPTGDIANCQLSPRSSLIDHDFGPITIDVLLFSDLPFRFEWTLEGSDGTPNQDFRCSQCGPCLGY